jgi:hypothetical protein
MLMADSELLDDRLYHYQQQHHQQQQPIYSNILGIFRRLRVEFRVRNHLHSEQFAINYKAITRKLSMTFASPPHPPSPNY